MYDMPPQILTSRLSNPSRSPQPTLVSMPSSRHYTPSHFIADDDLKDVQTQRKHQQSNKENKDYLTQKENLQSVIREQKIIMKNLLIHVRNQPQSSSLAQDFEIQLMNNLNKMEKMLQVKGDQHRVEVLEEENRRLCAKLSQGGSSHQEVEKLKTTLLLREQENVYLRRQLQELRCFIEENNLKDDQSNLVELVKHFEDQIVDLKSENIQLLNSLKDMEYEYITSKNQYEDTLNRVKVTMNETLRAKEQEMNKQKQKPSQDEMIRDLYSRFSQQESNDRQQLLQDIQLLQRDKKTLTEQLRLMSQDLKQVENSKTENQKTQKHQLNSNMNGDKFEQLKKKYINEMNLREQQEQDHEEKTKQLQRKIDELQNTNHAQETKWNTEKSLIEQHLKFEKSRNNELQQQITKLQMDMLSQFQKERLDTSSYYYERDMPIQQGNMENKFNDTLKSLKNELNTSQKQRNNLEQQIQDLQNQNDTMAKEINELKRQQWNKDQQEQQVLDKKFEQMRSEHQELQSQLDSIRKSSQDSLKKDHRDGLIDYLKQQNQRLETKLERASSQMENLRNSNFERSFYQKDQLTQVIEQLQSEFNKIRRSLHQQVEKTQMPSLEGMLQAIIDKFGLIESILDSRNQTSPIAQLLQSGPINLSSSPLYRNQPMTKFFTADENVYSFNPANAK